MWGGSRQGSHLQRPWAAPVPPLLLTPHHRIPTEGRWPPPAWGGFLKFSGICLTPSDRPECQSQAEPSQLACMSAWLAERSGDWLSSSRGPGEGVHPPASQHQEWARGALSLCCSASLPDPSLLCDLPRPVRHQMPLPQLPHPGPMGRSGGRGPAQRLHPLCGLGLRSLVSG